MISIHPLLSVKIPAHCKPQKHLIQTSAATAEALFNLRYTHHSSAAITPCHHTPPQHLLTPLMSRRMRYYRVRRMLYSFQQVKNVGCCLFDSGEHPKKICNCYPSSGSHSFRRLHYCEFSSSKFAPALVLSIGNIHHFVMFLRSSEDFKKVVPK